jgi:hypothetical protein
LKVLNLKKWRPQLKLILYAFLLFSN